MNFEKISQINDDDFLTIAEFSAIVDIPVSKLHYYDKKGIFPPASRGDGSKNKYRYYSARQITTIKMIRVLSEIGVSLETIAEMDKSRSPEKVMKLLSKNRKTISYEIDYLTEVLNIINLYHENIIDGINADLDEMSVEKMVEKSITLGEKADFENYSNFYGEFLAFCTQPRSPKLNVSYPVGGYFEDMECFLNHPSKPSRFFALNPNGQQKKEKGLYLVGYTRGYYGQTNDLPEKMSAYANEHKIIFDGPVYNIYLIDEISSSDPSQYLLQVAASIKETQHDYTKHPHHHFKR
jgi:DNA-binding transcriptional MerR regulator